MDNGVSVAEKLSPHFSLEQTGFDWQFGNRPIPTKVANSELFSHSGHYSDMPIK